MFDFDGTIAETTPLHARAFDETLAPLGIAADYRSIAGLSTQEAILRCLRTEGRCEADFDLPALSRKSSDPRAGGSRSSLIRFPW
jgi:beta-phosphoglucomutase-like phosphatase (HAD superfamily)